MAEAICMHHGLRIMRRGLTLAEVVIVILLTGLAAVCVLPFLGRSPHHHHNLACATRVNQIHKGMILYTNDNGGSYPIPMAISPETAGLNKQSGNSSANFYSYMIFNTYYAPSTVICPDEPNANVSVCNDYRYGTMDDVGWDDTWLWDPKFSADMTKPGANSSYASLALIGSRVEKEWTTSLNQKFVVLADRGPKDGAFDAASLTMKRHGQPTDWTGNIVFNDGHVQTITAGKDEADAFVVNGDNLFRQDDEVESGDMWLSVFGPTDEKTATPYWD